MKKFRTIINDSHSGRLAIIKQHPPLHRFYILLYKKASLEKYFKDMKATFEDKTPIRKAAMAQDDYYVIKNKNNFVDYIFLVLGELTCKTSPVHESKFLLVIYYDKLVYINKDLIKFLPQTS